jgi:hypothetical protein
LRREPACTGPLSLANVRNMTRRSNEDIGASGGGLGGIGMISLLGWAVAALVSGLVSQSAS